MRELIFGKRKNKLVSGNKLLFFPKLVNKGGEKLDGLD